MNPAIEIGVDDTPFNRHYMAVEKEPSRKLLYDTKVAPPNQPNKFVNVSHGVSRVRQGMYAFHVETGPAYQEVEKTFFEHEKCGLIEIAFLQIVDPWCAIQKYSPFKEILKVAYVLEHEIIGFIFILFVMVF